MNIKNKKCCICISGEPGVGKSSIVQQFVNKEFSTQYTPTLEDSYFYKLDLDEEIYNLDILDTAGQEEFCDLKNNYILNGNAFIIVYSISCKGSFKEVKNIRDNIINLKNTEDVPIIIVGNKIDIEEKERKVSKLEGINLAKQLNCIFIETSAKQNLNILEIFTSLVKDWNKKLSTWKKISKKSSYSIKNTNDNISKEKSKEKNIIVSENDVYLNSNQNSYFNKVNSDDCLNHSSAKTTIKLKHNISMSSIEKNRLSKPKCPVQ
ncbi:hypothetical protein RB653_005882 [Dictyostelium firmibasis]|uniref:Uncharacterized protein n=1 Tax=Dictyostelium firmibasis TaxID=79012 RepID=A0AAN7U235_9MYCE